MPIKMSKHVCGFCSTDTHKYCPSVIRNGDPDELIKCPCECEQSQTVRCVVCNNRQPEEINADTYTCNDPGACISEYNRKRQTALDTLYPNGQQTHYRPVSKSAKSCKCECGEQTGGGQFRPGHADKLVANLAKEIKAGGIAEDDAREMLLHISEGLIKKLEARL
jgi:hypothetical protein